LCTGEALAEIGVERFEGWARADEAADTPRASVNSNLRSPEWGKCPLCGTEGVGRGQVCRSCNPVSTVEEEEAAAARRVEAVLAKKAEFCRRERATRARLMEERRERDREALVNEIAGCQGCGGSGRIRAGRFSLIGRREPCLACRWERERLAAEYGEEVRRGWSVWAKRAH
jgi:hypothetical protein